MTPAASTPGMELIRAIISWKITLRFWSPVFRGGSGVVVCDIDGRGVFGLEAEVDIENMEETAQEEASADEQDAGEGDLGYNENGAGALVFAALARAECRSP